MMMMMMILAVLNERVRVRADTPRGVVPPGQVAATAQEQLLRRGSWVGARVFVRMTPNRLALRRKCLLPEVTSPA